MLEHVRVPTVDGVELFVCVLRADSLARGVVIILPGVGSTQVRYVELARFLREDGWTAVTFDYRGVGRSGLARRSCDNTMEHWGARDFDAVIRWVLDNLAPRRLVALGHSIGGQLIPMAPLAGRLDAAVCVAAQRGHWRHWTGARRVFMWSLWHLYIPIVARLLGRLPLPEGRQPLHSSAARAWAGWGRCDDYPSATGSLRSRFAELEIPILFLSFADDAMYAPKAAVDALIRDYFVAARRLHCHVEPEALGLATIGHSGFFASAQCPRAWWEDLSRWMASVERDHYPPCSLIRAQPSKLRLTECHTEHARITDQPAIEVP